MQRLDVQEAHANFAAMLASVERGETVIICHRGVEIAEVRPKPAPRVIRAKPGAYRGVRILDGFDAIPDGF